ncbi:MAG TPA: universal stress protein [Agriterribacter sp.]|nr:universal stress protein [Agriterribacter sp.]
MNKILVAINAADPKTNTLDFACFIATLTRSKLSVLAIETLQTENIPVVKRVHGMTYVATIADEQIPENKAVREAYSRNTTMFENFCQSRGVNMSVQHLKNPLLDDMILDTRFADMLIVDPDMSLDGSLEGTPTRLIKDLLSKSECPVILAPLSFDGIDEILLAYDGSKSAVFSIRQFIHLFPELTDKKITVLQVNEQAADDAVIEREKIQKLLQLHFSSIGFTTLNGDPSGELFGYLLGKRNMFVVMGAFGRNMLSNFFRQSTAQKILSTLNLPLFISHH